MSDPSGKRGSSPSGGKSSRRGRSSGRFSPSRFGSWIDQTLDQARRDGAFENLEGHGKPLKNLDRANDPLWWAKDLMRREGLEVLPPSLEIRRKVQQLRDHLAEIPREADLVAAVEALNVEIRRLNTYAQKGPPTTQAPLDLETERARWREARAAVGSPGSDG